MGKLSRSFQESKPKEKKTRKNNSYFSPYEDELALERRDLEEISLAGARDKFGTARDLLASFRPSETEVTDTMRIASAQPSKRYTKEKAT